MAMAVAFPIPLLAPVIMKERPTMDTSRSFATKLLEAFSNPDLLTTSNTWIISETQPAWNLKSCTVIQKWVFNTILELLCDLWASETELLRQDPWSGAKGASVWDDRALHRAAGVSIGPIVMQWWLTLNWGLDECMSEEMTWGTTKTTFVQETTTSNNIWLARTQFKTLFL